MTITPNKNLEFLSVQNQVKSKKDQMLENLKLEMLKDLKLENKLIKRNSLADKLVEQIVNHNNMNIDFTEFFGKKKINFDENKYKDMTEKYKEIVKLSVTDPDRKNKQIERCKELAEQMILDQNKMIEFSSTEQFDGKTAEQEAKKSFERLGKNKKYSKKIELIKKTDGEETHFVIKRTKKQLEELERAEKAYEALHGTEQTNEKDADIQANKVQELEGNFTMIVSLQKQLQPGDIIVSVTGVRGESPLFRRNESDKRYDCVNYRGSYPEGLQKKEMEDLQRKYKRFEVEKGLQEPQQTVNTMHETMKEKLKKLGIQLKSMNINEIIILPLDITGGKIIKLQKESDYGWEVKTNQVTEFDKYIEHEKDENDETKHARVSNKNLWEFLHIPEDEKPVPEPTPVIQPEIPREISSEQEVTATISNTYQIRYAKADRDAGEELRERRKKTIWRNAPAKLNLFLRRKSIKEGIINKNLRHTDRGKTGRLDRNKDAVAAADRHEMEEQEQFDERIQNIVGKMVGIENDYPNTYAAIVKLVEQFTGTDATGRQGTLDETGFRNKFEDILKRSGALDPNRPGSAHMPASGKDRRRPLPELLSTNDMAQLSTNIFEKMKAFKAEKRLVLDIYNKINQKTLIYPDRVNDQTQFDALSQAVSTDTRPLIAKYVKDYQTMPTFLKTLKLNLDDANVMKDLIKMHAHNCALRSILQQTMNLKLQVLNKGEEAYDVREKLNGMAKIGRWLDDPFSRSKYFKKHPGFKKFMGVVRGTTKLAAFASAGIVATATGAPLLMSAGLYGAGAFTKTLFAKYSHYNKEHRLYKRNQAQNVLNTRTERDRIANAVAGMSRRQGRFRGEKMRQRRQLKYYINTTHDQLQLSGDLINDMENLLTKQKELTPAEQDMLRAQTADALARLDAHKNLKEGENFLGSKTPAEAEQEYQKLQRLVLTSSLRLNTTLDIIRQDPNSNYTPTLNLIRGGRGDGKRYNNQGYEQARKRFKTRERQQAYLGATKAGVVAFGMAYAMGSLTSKPGHEETKITGTGSGKSEYMLGKYQDVNYAKGNLNADITKFLNNPKAVTPGGDFNIVLTGSTDATQVTGSAFNAGSLATRKADVLKNISDHVSNGTLNPAYGKTLTTWVNAKTSTLPTLFPGHENANLASMRVLNGIRDLTDSLASSTNPAVTTGSLHLNISAVGTPSSSIVYNQSDRFVAAAMQAQKDIYVPGTHGFAFGEGFDNTFAINDTFKKDAPKNGTNENPYDRSNRYRTGTPSETRFGA